MKTPIVAPPGSVALCTPKGCAQRNTPTSNATTQRNGTATLSARDCALLIYERGQRNGERNGVATVAIATQRSRNTGQTGTISTPAICSWCGSALAPYLLDLAGRPALLCLRCHRWTYIGGTA